jgi:acetyl-CoA/propionyl-CoA carboxylase biotin carboxyl carrier protein
MRRALDELEVAGVATTVPALARVLDHPDFRAAGHWTTWLEEAVDLGGLAPAAVPEPEADFHVTVDGRTWPVRLYRHRPAAAAAAAGSAVVSPLAGTLARLAVEPGQRDGACELLAVVEAMKMETPLLAPFSGTVIGVRSRLGGPVAAGQVVLDLEAGEPP